MGATPKEEIQRQHEEAVSLLSTTPICSPSYHDEIPLEWKERPTESDPFYEDDDDDNSDDADEHDFSLHKQHSIRDRWFFSSRGHVDVTAIADLVREGYNTPLPPTPTSDDDTSSSSSTITKNKTTKKNTKSQNKSPPPPTIESLTDLWSTPNAAKHNVDITRPSHDTWGIKKITLIFSDDFLTTIYTLPWYHTHPFLTTLLPPILTLLNLSEHRIVRLLFASLPPGVTIPIHHDSGEWVKHTHRVHIPIIATNPDQILFRVGRRTDEMQRIDVRPGHVFEINNQAKHAVSNNMDDYRVHLILDYVDEDFFLSTAARRRNVVKRVRLSPGEVVYQTRRSIDRMIDRGSRPCPSYCILGAQKAGTTSLYDYLNQHPLAFHARRRETHCLDWRWNETLKTTSERRQWCRKFYFAKWMEAHPSCLSGDSTPSYLLHSDLVIPRMKEVWPWGVKLLVMLRDPVERAKSHFEMVTSKDGTDAQKKVRGTEWLEKSFEDVLHDDIRLMHKCGLIPYWNMQTHTIDDRALFHSFINTPDEDKAFSKYQSHIPMNTGSHSLLARGLYALQLRRWLDAFPSPSSPSSSGGCDQLLVCRMEEFREEGGVERVMTKVWRHLGLPEITLEDEAAKNTRSYDGMAEETKGLLRRFYGLQNERLVGLLGEEWRDVWKY